MSISRRSTLIALPAVVGTAFAQPARPSSSKRVGVLFGGSEAELQALVHELNDALTGLGWKPGSSVVVEGVHADGDSARLPALADELVRKAVDVIVTGAASSTLAAARATTSIPIVFLSVRYPVEQGLVRSYARPGTNVTGPSLYPGLDLMIKPLDFLREIAPAARKLALVCPAQFIEIPTLAGPHLDIRPVLRNAAGRLRFDVNFHLMPPKRDELGRMFKEIVAGGAEVLFGGITGSPTPMIEFAQRERLPALYPLRYFVEAGGLMSYGVNQADAERAPVHVARYVDRILRGTPPAELAVEQPSRFELTLNLKAAKAIGLVFPQGVLLRADAVIG